jgi:hypothetical protein
MRKYGVSGVVLMAGGAAAAALLLNACSKTYVPPAEIAAASAKLPEEIDYNWHVRPILSQNCFNCHGNSASTREAGLRLDTEESAYGELPENKGKHAIVPGDPAASELVRRITSQDPDERMPPLKAHKVLSPVEVATLVKWVDDGAEYKEHWAYIPPKLSKPKKSELDRQAVNQIDRYVFAKLQEHGLKPSAEADKETLLNRVYLTLTGLPPSLEDVDAFVADQRPDAYEKVVDKLLASSAYSERMAQTWLDVARYADTDGYLNDSGGRLLYPYRDWVISAFKKNLPYDKFVTWQVAGDQLKNPTQEQILATSFLRQGKRNAEGGIIDEEWRVEYVNERTELVGTAFLGLTVGCAKCHDHKYDVISQADYYSIAGFFNNMDEGGIHGQSGGMPMGPTLAWPTEQQKAAFERVHKETLAQESTFNTTTAAIRKDLTPQAAALAKAPPAELGAKLAASIEAATQAYYPLDSTYIASFEPLMIEPARGRFSFEGGDDEGVQLPGQQRQRPDAGQQRQGQRPGGPSGPGGSGAPDAAAGFGGPGGPGGMGAAGAPRERQASADLSKATARALREGRYKFENAIAITSRRLMVGLNEAVLAWTPSGREGDKPGTVNNAKFIDGPPGKGKAVHIYDTIGFAASDVGKFDRLNEFSLDLWVKLREGKPYKESSILYNQSRGGYDLLLDENRLRFDMVHNPPHNMLSVRTVEKMPQGKWVHIAMTYDGSSRAAGVKLYIDGVEAKTEIYRDHLTRTSFPRGGHSLLGSFYGLAFGTRRGQEEFMDGAVDEIRVFTKSLNPLEVRYLHDPAAVASLKAETLQAALTDLLASQDERMAEAKATLKKARETEGRVESTIPQLMVAHDAPVDRPNYILDRGIYDKYLKETPAGIPSRVFAAKGDNKMERRIDLANWLFHKDNPLTARVYVNRLWQLHFGAGIVATVQDFGTQGSNPTHPELLDWLAIEFAKSGWDIAHMHKLIVMSATYRQSSKATPELLEQDPTNRLLARGPRYRLPAEMVRDSALFASGLLIDKVGGDAVFPYQPDGVWQGNGLGANIYPTEQDVTPDQFHRRSMYTYIKRNAQPASMMIFDGPDRNVATVARTISNTPLQALVLLNDPQYMEAYRKMAERALASSTDPQAQIKTVFRLATRRTPLAGEVEALAAYRTAEIERLAGAKNDVDELLSIGVAPCADGVDRVQLAGLTMVAAAAMNSPDAYTLR